MGDLFLWGLGGGVEWGMVDKKKYKVVFDLSEE